MFEIVSEHVFPFLRDMGESGHRHAAHMKDARFTIPTPALLAKVVDMLDDIPMEDRDTKGDLYEYMLGKIATAGQNGQFRTPRHIIELMVELMAPTPKDVICDPAAGTGGFLVAAGEYLRDNHPSLFRDDGAAQALPRDDVPRLRLRQHHAAHRLDEHAAARRRGANLRYRDSLAEEQRRRRRRLFADPRQSALRRLARLRDDGQGPAQDRQDEEDRAAVHGAVPEAAEARRARGGDRAGRRAVRLLDGAQGDPQDAGRGPQARRDHQAALGRVPALCRRLDRDRLFTKTNSGGTDHVWFYDVQADGFEPRRQAHAAAAGRRSSGRCRPRR